MVATVREVVALAGIFDGAAHSESRLRGQNCHGNDGNANEPKQSSDAGTRKYVRRLCGHETQPFYIRDLSRPKRQPNVTWHVTY